MIGNLQLNLAGRHSFSLFDRLSLSLTGIILDNNLTYDQHIHQLTSSCMTKLCQINRVKNSFDRDTLCTIISALVLSKLFYCSTVWSNTTATNIKKLQAVQNFACRIITKTKKFEHITPALREIKWLPVNEHLHYTGTPNDRFRGNICSEPSRMAKIFGSPRTAKNFENVSW